MGFAVPRRYEGDNLPAQRILRGATEHLFGSGIEQHYPLILVYRDDGIHRRTDDAGKLRLPFAKHSFHQLAFGDIRGGRDKVSDSSQPVMHRDEREVYVDEAVRRQPHTCIVP